MLCSVCGVCIYHISGKTKELLTLQCPHLSRLTAFSSPQPVPARLSPALNPEGRVGKLQDPTTAACRG